MAADRPVDGPTEAAFANQLETIYERHGAVLFTMARGAHELRTSMCLSSVSSLSTSLSFSSKCGGWGRFVKGSYSGYARRSRRPPLGLTSLGASRSRTTRRFTGFWIPSTRRASGSAC